MKAALSTLLGAHLPAPVEGALERLLVLDRFQEFLHQVQTAQDGRPFLERTLSALRIRPQVSGRDLELVPKEGPVIAVANHPFGLVEGAVLGQLLRSVRTDVKIVANHLLSEFPAAEEHCIFVDPFGGVKATRFNQRGLKASIGWLESGGMLAVFPAGEVAHLNLMERPVIDPEWNHNVARIVRLT